MLIHYVVDGGPQCPAGSRWVVLQVRRGNAGSGPVGSPQTLYRVVKQLVRIREVPGRIRSLELRLINQLVLCRNASRVILTGLLIWCVRHPP